MLSAKIVKPNQIDLEDLPIPRPGPGEATVQVMASGICGTDIHIFRGEYLGQYPVIPGHEFAGVVTAVSPQVTRFRVGDRVAIEPNIACNNCVNCLNNRQNFCLNWQAVGVTRPGGMAQYVTVPENAMFDIGSLPFEKGAFMEPLSCVLHGIDRTGIRLADRVAIWGAGPIGILMIQAVRLQGAAQIVSVDSNLSRAEFARQMGADVSLESVEALERDAFDVVIDATGAIPMMAKTLDYVRYGGTVLLFGVPPSGKLMEIEPFKIFRKGLKVLSSYTSVRNSYQAVELLRTGKIDVAPLLSHQLALADFPRGLNLIETRMEGVRKVMIRPNGM